MNKFVTIIIGASFVILACGDNKPSPSPSTKVEAKHSKTEPDTTRQSLEANTEPKRIVSLGAGVTETVFALGLGDRVVGVDVSSLHPKAALGKPKVGYIRMTSAEGIASLKPDLVLAGSTLGPATVKSQLTASGIRLELVEKPKSLEGAEARIKAIGDILNRKKQAQDLIDALKTKVQKVRDQQKGKPRPRILFVFVHGGTSINVAGSDTAADVMIKAAGGQNAVTDYVGYKPITAEALMAAKPDIILATPRSLKAVGGEKGLWATPGIALTPAGKIQKLVVIDDLKLLSFGPRTGDAVIELSKLFSE